MKLLIGCPIYKREWILHHWIRCLINQSVSLDKVGFIFETSSDDATTIAILETWKKIEKNLPHMEIVIRDDIPHFEHIENGRQWTLSRYENMVNLRNKLLERVRDIDPDYYFSLDSDILLENPNTIECLIAHIKSGADGVSPLMFMTPFGDMYPSVMSWRNDGSDKAMRHERYPIGQYFQSDVIMAAKLMSKPLYQTVNYRVHEQGEDVGWSWDAKEAGFKLYSASYLYAPHIMSEQYYEHFLQYGDQRHADYDKNHPSGILTV